MGPNYTLLWHSLGLHHSTEFSNLNSQTCADVRDREALYQAQLFNK